MRFGGINEQMEGIIVTEIQNLLRDINKIRKAEKKNWTWGDVKWMDEKGKKWYVTKQGKRN